MQNGTKAFISDKINNTNNRGENNMTTVVLDKLKQRKTYLFILLLNFLALSPLIIFSQIHYRMDSYGILVNGIDFHIEAFLGSYRFFGAFVYWIISLVGHNPITNPVPDTIFFIIIATVIVTIFVLYLYKEINHKSILLFFIIDGSVLITVLNVWFTDLLTFSECISLTAIGLLCCFAGIVVLAKSDRLWKYILASVLFIFASATYQQFISIFLIYTILILCIKQFQTDNKGIKKIFIGYIIPFVFILINSVVYFLAGSFIQKIMGIESNPRASMSLSTLLNNINYFFRHQHSFLKGRGVFETEILTFCYIFVAVMFLVSLISFWKKKHKTINVAFVGVSFIMAYIGAYLPGLVSTSHATRTVCALFSVFALLAIGAVALNQSRLQKILLACVLFIVLSLNIYKTIEMETNLIRNNVKEASYADSIIHAINKYEKNNGATVNTIGICYDEYGDTNLESLYAHFAIKPLLQLRSNKHLIFIDPSEIVTQTYFEGKDWQYFDADEQIVFDKNIAYVCIY